MKVAVLLLLLLMPMKNGNAFAANGGKVTQSAPVQWLTFNEGATKPHIVLVSGDEEYRSEEALPQLAKILAYHHKFKCTVLFAQDPQKPGILNPNYVQNIPGLELLESADLMIISTRFRALPDEQMQYIDNYLKAGKPVIGMRTATHAFRFEGVDESSSYLHYGNFYDTNDAWKDGFGRLVLGEKWIAHHGRHGYQSTRGVLAKDAQSHPILNGIEDGAIWGPTDVYKVRLPLPGDTRALVFGQVVDAEAVHNENDPLLGMRPTDSKLPAPFTRKNADNENVMIDQNDPMMPVSWIKSYQIPEGKKGKVFTTTMGSSTDLLSEAIRRMLVNAAYWCFDLNVPRSANVDIVGVYNPTRFKFHKDSYWEEKNLSIESLK